MPSLTIDLPLQESQTRFNLHRWAELLADPELAKIEGRIETDRHGHIIMSPPPAPSHGSYQLWIGHLLTSLMPRGRVITECPVSTAAGVKAADVAWVSPELLRKFGNQACFPHAPEICVEVISPGNTVAEMNEKISLYFDADAEEVWVCSAVGVMSFHSHSGDTLKASSLYPAFPKRIKLK
jgi:Uma2 family endonuclease